ncbi:hypothetical protein [Antrihabitans cavernicola]|uniref:hypothetical protein n=1 Tax=Antrihabitans cavernicola TaxID=2495913 RepID=UPI00338FC2BF
MAISHTHRRHVIGDCWTEPVRDAMGLPIPVNPAKPDGRKRTRARQESFGTREDAEARRDELNAARHTTGTATLADQRKAGDLPYGYYAQAWLDSMEVKVAQGRLKRRTLDDYERVLRRYALRHFAGLAVASITPRQCEEFLSALVRQQSRQGADGRLEPTLSPATIKHAWGTFGRVLKYSVRHGAIPSSPTDRVDFATNRATGDHDAFEHTPLTATQLAELSAAIAGQPTNGQELPAYPVYGLMVDFLAYSGLRASENAGLQIEDLVFTTPPALANGSPRFDAR